MYGVFGAKKIGQPDKSSDASLYAGYAIAALAGGDEEDARELFRQALAFGRRGTDDIVTKNGMKVPASLFNAFLRVHHHQTSREARVLWWAVVEQDEPVFHQAFIEALEASEERDPAENG